MKASFLAGIFQREYIKLRALVLEDPFLSLSNHLIINRTCTFVYESIMRVTIVFCYMARTSAEVMAT